MGAGGANSYTIRGRTRMDPLTIRYGSQSRGKEEGVYRNMSIGSAKNVVVKYFSFLYRYIFSYAQVCCVGVSLLAVVAGTRPRILGLMSGTADL